MIESVYLMPEVGENLRIFEFLSLSDSFDINFLSWIPPQKKRILGTLCHANE